MMKDLYPLNWDALKITCFMDANWECAHCGVVHGTLRQSRRTGIVFPVLLHAAHKAGDIDNPTPDLIALCPSCHLKYDRRVGRVRSPRRTGYQVVSVPRLTEALAQGGLMLAPNVESGCVTWQCAGLAGEASDPLAALIQALHFLQGELRESQGEQGGGQAQ